MVEIRVMDNSKKGDSVGQTSDAILVMVDGSKLMQVVSNLLSNAVKFTDVGEILITIEDSPIDSVLVNRSID